MDAKQLAGERAAEFVEDGMAVGLGTGSTVFWTIQRLGERVAREGLRLRCVPTSRRTEEQARALGLPLVTFADVRRLDLTIDGADEINPDLALVKGGGGALLREKLVASASARLVVVADATKLVPTLGQFPLPVEVVPFAWEVTAGRVAATGCAPALRHDDAGRPYLTDNGNYVLDCPYGAIQDPAALERRLKLLTGVIDCGLFVGLAHLAVVATADAVELIERAP